MKTDICETKYPIVLIHGFAWKDMKIAEYWYKIPEYLREQGATVYVTNQDAWNSHKERAGQVAVEIGDFIHEQKCDKVNLVCHSQGSMDARWLIEKLEMKNKDGRLTPAKQLIASYTSIAGVHRGSKIADIVVNGIPKTIRPRLARGLDKVAGLILHDKDPNAWEAVKELGTEYMNEIFNKECPMVDDSNGGEKDGIYYQSYTTRIRLGVFLSMCPADRLLIPTWLILKHIDGENDGVVSVSCAKFGKFRGVKAGISFGPGICHLAQINQFVGLVCFFNAKKWMAEIVSDLKSLGF
jgi:triacylglycerol lipase